MRTKWFKSAASAAALLAVVFSAAAESVYDADITLNKETGVYRVGETAICSVKLLKDQKPLVSVKARMILKIEEKTVKTQDFEATGEPVSFSYTGTKPEWVYFGFEVLDGNGKAMKLKTAKRRPRKPTIAAEVGVMFSPDKIVPATEKPADYDEFWAKRRAELDQIPLMPEMVELDSKVPGVKLFGVTLPAARGITATGYLAYPANAKPKSLPAYVSFQSHSNEDPSSRKAVMLAKNGALAFHCSWHGFPLGKKKNYYSKNIHPYYQSGKRDLGDRDKWVYGDIIFRVMRELDFVKSLPEWDGKTLVVIGGSLGGVQSAAAAGLDKDVTLAVISVPGGCDFGGYKVGRKSGGVFKSMPEEKLRKNPALVEAGLYYDTVNFARNIKCETYVCTGFVDETCYPSNIYAMYNAIPSTTKKFMSANPYTGHFGTTKNVGADERMKNFFKAVTITALPKESQPAR